MVAQNSAAGTGRYLTLILNREAYGIAIDKVREIIHAGKITPVASLSAAMIGMINLHGRVIPVMDLPARLGLGALTQDRPCVVIVQVHGYKDTPVMMGLAADAVGEVLRSEPDKDSTEPGFSKEPMGLWLIGSTKFNGRNITLLDIDRVVASELAPVVR